MTEKYGLHGCTDLHEITAFKEINQTRSLFSHKDTHVHKQSHKHSHTHTANLGKYYTILSALTLALDQNPSHRSSCVADTITLPQLYGLTTGEGETLVGRLTPNTQELDQTIPIYNGESCEMHLLLSVFLR